MTPATNPVRAARTISAATLISRLLGLARDQVQSYYFGAGFVTDAFLAAFRIPNLLRDLFAEGALSSAFVPTFTREMERHGRARGFDLANKLMTVLGVLLGGLTLLIFFGAPWILRFYVPGFEGEKLLLATQMTRILSPFLLFVALAAVAMGMLNACGRFFLPALAPASFNVAAIVGVVGLVPVLSLWGLAPGLALAIGACIGGALQFLVQVPPLVKEGFRFRPRWDPSDAALRRVGRLMLPATFGLAATQINILVDTILASQLGDAPITWLALAFRLMQLPIGLFGVALATANLAHVSRDLAKGDEAGARGNLAASLRAAALLTLPATAGLVALREPIVALLFEHGAFTAQDTVQTGAAAAFYAIGLFAYASTKIQVPTFYALGSARVPVIASTVAVTVKIACNFLFLWLFPSIGLSPHLALAGSTSLAAWLNFLLLSAALRSRLGSMRRHRVLPVTLALAVSSACMGAACAWLFARLHGLVPSAGLIFEVARLTPPLALGLVWAWATARLLRMPELAMLLRRGGGDASEESS